MTVREEMLEAKALHEWILERLLAGDEQAVRDRFETVFLTAERQRECVEQYSEWLAELERLEKETTSEKSPVVELRLLPTQVKCDACEGRGYFLLTLDCPKCKGRGWVESAA